MRAHPPTPPDTGRAEPASTVWQARVPRELTEALEADMALLGLSGRTDAVREGLKLLHRRAQEVSLGREYEQHYQGGRAPVSEVTAALYQE